MVRNAVLQTSTPPNPWNITNSEELIDKLSTQLDKFHTSVVVLASFLAIVSLLLFGALFLLFLQRREIRKLRQISKEKLFSDTRNTSL
jgi:hypothetical protein